MNKQQLAAKIWESANQMRSKIEANEYKDYILGFIFYKYLSDQLVQYVTKEGMTPEDIKALNEEDADTVKGCSFFLIPDHKDKSQLTAIKLAQNCSQRPLL